MNPLSNNNRLSRRLLIKGIFFSLLFHISFFLLFRIQKDPSSENMPQHTTVLLSDEDSSLQITTEDTSKQDNPTEFYTNLFGITHEHSFENGRPISASTIPDTADSNAVENALQPVLPWTFTDTYAPSRQPKHPYPLTLILHSSIRHFYLVDDGSSIFIDTIPNSPTSYCSHARPKIVYHIKICPTTGKILQATCEKELYDKRLQHIADSLIKKITFFINERAIRKNIWEGKISLQFSGTFDTIAPLIKENF